MRPKEAPTKIPTWAWERLKLSLPKTGTVVNRPPFSHGAMLRHPNGGVENVQEMFDAGYRWVGLNVSDFPRLSWNLVRSRSAAAGAQVLPKGRLHGEGYLENVLDTALAWGCKYAVVNLEDEAKSWMPPSRVAEILARYPTVQPFISSVGWLYNAVDWTPLAQYPFSLQIYWEDSRWPKDKATIAARERDCLAHAKELGISQLAVTYQVVRSTPDLYDLSASRPWNIAYGDDVGQGNWKEWSPT